MIEQSDKFEGWAVVEMLGHRKLAGAVSEQVIAGSALVRVDVPETTHRRDVGGFTGHTLEVKPAYTKLIGVGSIYCITPCTEDIARRAATELKRYNDPLPVTLPKLLAAGSGSANDVVEDAEVEPWSSDDDDDEERG